MANKAVAIIFLSLIACSLAADTCIISTSLITTLSVLCGSNSGVCVTTSALIQALCVAQTGILGLGAPVNITLPSTITSFSISGSSTIAGLNIASSASASAALTIDLSAVNAITNYLVVSGYATVNAAQGAAITIGGDLRTSAETTLNIAGNVTVAGATYIQGKLHLAGSVAVNAAQTAWLKATTTQVTVAGSASATATISGNGGIDADVVVSGNVTIAPGNSPGAVFIRGDFTMSGTSTLQVEVDSALSYDQMYIGGRFNRAGILHVDVGSYRPNSGQRFTIATHSSQSGTFSISRGNFDETLDEIHPRYNDLSTEFQYGSAAAVALPFALIALCILGLVF
jgi:hypothetical protein